MAYYLGLDIGTSGAKALLVDAAGAKIASFAQEYPLSTPRPLWAEQNPADWWNACVVCTQNVLAQAGIDASVIKCIGLSGQMHGSVFLDKHNNVLRPALLWCDQRTQPECDWITAQVGGENLARLIGNPVLTGFTSPKIVWLRNNEPDIYARVAKVLLPKDYIRFCLTGTFATEVSDASGTALFDIAGRKWSADMLAATDIPAAWLPPCAESIEITAHVSAQSAMETGLAAGTPVVGGAGDQAAGAIGSGVVQPGVVSSTVGTSGVVFAYASAPAVDPSLRLHTFCHAVPNAWHVMGVCLSAGGSLRWLRDTFFQPEGVVGRTLGVDPYELMAQGAKTIALGADGLIFLPYLTGARTPYPDPDARGVFFGLTLRHTRAHFTRAVMEGVAYALNDTFQLFAELGIPVAEVRAGGGGAKSDVWRQIHADVSGYPHAALAVEEGPALGAAILAMAGTHAYASVGDACRAVVQTAETCVPQADAHGVYQKFYPLYRALYPALQAQFAAVSDAVSL